MKMIRIKNVEHVDDYTGMIKYNTGGRGLTAGIREQVGALVDLLSVVPNLQRLHIHLIDGAISRIRFPSGRVHRVQDEKNYSLSQAVLDPFKRLYGVRKAEVSGVSEEYSKVLEKSMTDSRGVPSSHVYRAEEQRHAEQTFDELQLVDNALATRAHESELRRRLILSISGNISTG
jgi:hypothetical protein